MKKFKIIVGAIVIIVIVGWLAKAPLLQAIADHLIIEETMEESDVIIVLGGEIKGERTKRAVDLYTQGYADTLLFSDGTDLSWRTKAVEEMTALAMQLGVPKRDILTETNSRSTYENALYTKDLMLEYNYQSAIVVTTDWHSKRSKFIFDKIFENTNIKLTYAHAPDERIDSLQNWWEDPEKQQIVLTEWAKYIVYLLKY